MINISAANITAKVSDLSVYRRLDDDTIATASGNRVAIWATDGDDALQLANLSAGTSGLTADQMIDKLWNRPQAAA